MAGNTFGKLLKLTTFGESHGEALGGIIDGCPAGIHLDFDFIQAEMQRENLVNLLLLHNEKKKTKYSFYQEFLKVKLQELQLVLLFQIPIKSQMIIRI